MGLHDDAASGATRAVALRALPVVPATTTATAAATPSANSESFLLNAPSSIVRPDVFQPREEPYPPSDLRWGSISRRCPGFKLGRSCFRQGLQCWSPAAVAQLVDAMASKAIVLRDVWVRVPPAASNRRSRARSPARAAMTKAAGEDARES